MVFETKRFMIHAAANEEILRYIEGQTNDILKTAYQEMLLSSVPKLKTVIRHPIRIK